MVYLESGIKRFWKVAGDPLRFAGVADRFGITQRSDDA
jgi:hypothetical protein